MQQYHHILITGTSSGLGNALTEYYLQQNKQVYGMSRSAAKNLQQYPNFHFASCDLTQPQDVEVAINSLLSDVEQLDLVVLNAGVLNELKDMRDTPLTEIQKVMDINTWANKSLIDVLSEKVALIDQVVAISSGASVSGNRGWNAYSLSKATLNMLIKLYSEELPAIHFSALAPGLIDTAMQDYICSLDDPRFQVVTRLKSCRGTELMPSPTQLVSKLDAGFKAVKLLDSGMFTDIRNLELS